MLVLVLQVFVFIIDSDICADALSVYYDNIIKNNVPTSDVSNQLPNVEDEALRLSRHWAPLVWLAPDEKFMPDSVENFLQNVKSYDKKLNKINTEGPLPTGTKSQNHFLVPASPIPELLKNNSSFLYGKNPEKYPVPTYAVISRCHTHNVLDNSVDRSRFFQVTYWFFYPFNEGKRLCFLGFVPIPQIFNKCLGHNRLYGNHMGDWEHVSLLFNGMTVPDQMYISTHDAGAFYNYQIHQNQFVFSRQETRKGVIQKPVFPRTVNVKNGRPIVFSARGSHGMWAQPGTHRFVRLPKLSDMTGAGTRWKTWKNLEFIDLVYSSARWVHFQGHWGPPRDICHPIKKFWINVCQYNSGPTGIPLKPQHFTCPKS